MKKSQIVKFFFVTAFLAVFGVIMTSGCSQKATSEATGAPIVKEEKLTADQELERFCRVCVVNSGERDPHYLPSRLDTKYKGKMYRFCAEGCREEFLKTPKKYELAEAHSK